MSEIGLAVVTFSFVFIVVMLTLWWILSRMADNVKRIASILNGIENIFKLEMMFKDKDQILFINKNGNRKQSRK